MTVTTQILWSYGESAERHRYWRFKNFTGTTVSFFETTEMQVFEDGVNVASGITPTASATPGGFGLIALTNGSLDADQIYWATAVADTLIITWDFATSKAVNGLKIARFDTAGRFPTAFTVDWSDDNSLWTTVGTYAITEPSTNYTLSATVTFP